MKKSTRHSKITGNFCENIILYWLSKTGFECANIDHTGIDIIARNPHTNEVMGISVKGRSRYEGTEGESINIPNENFDKIERACRAFNCAPYFAIVVDGKNKIFAFVLSMEHLLKISPKGIQVYWKMTKKDLEKYHIDPEIMMVEFDYKTHNWWK